MTRPSSLRTLCISLVLLTGLATTLAVSPAAGQTGPPAPPRTPDFLFGQPKEWVAVRAGWTLARADSDWYDFVTDQLTIGQGAFDAAGVAADLGFTVAPRIDAVAGVTYRSTSTPSEYRRFVDNDRLPIEQTTTLRTVDLTASAKVALRSRGREVSRLAFVPNDVVPFVGAGGGALYYRLSQVGDFVDFRDSSIFPSTFRSQGWTPSLHAFGGVDLRVSRRLSVTLDARYHWASARLDQAWVDFEPIDLSGVTFSAGMAVVF